MVGHVSHKVKMKEYSVKELICSNQFCSNSRRKKLIVITDEIERHIIDDWIVIGFNRGTFIEGIDEEGNKDRYWFGYYDYLNNRELVLALNTNIEENLNTLQQRCHLTRYLK